MSGPPPTATPFASRHAVIEPGAADRPPGAFTRDDLDAAEPEARPSFRRCWIIGVVLGAVGGAVAGWAGPISLLAIVALPWALTPAGAGLLVGSGSLWLPYLVIVADQAGAAPTDVGTVLLAGVPLVLFAIGLVGTLLAHRRVRSS